MAWVLANLTAILKFKDQIIWLVLTLQKTPAEKQAALVTSMQKEAENFEKTGRPTWN